MPPKSKFTRAEILTTALDITRESGLTALTARALAARLGCSVKPIFGLFQNMEEVQQEVLLAAKSLYERCLAEEMSRGSYPPYKASGIAYIRFAKEETSLFKLLFMRDRSAEEHVDEREDIASLIDLIAKNTGLSKDEAYLFHLEMWIFVHGIATMEATAYLNWEEAMISQVMTDMYQGLAARFQKRDEKTI